MKVISPNIIITISCVLLLQACSFVPKLDKVLPDKRKDYQKSEALPDLEIPPDLTTEAINDNMSIPNERAATLSRYKNAPVATKAQAGVTKSEEQWLAVRGSTQDIWPGLREYFTSQGYQLELDDAELGVLVTGWSPPVESGGFAYRSKYKIFSEPGADQISTVLFITNQSQQRIGEAGGETWLDLERDRDAEKQLAIELNNHLAGNASVATAASTSDWENPDAGATTQVQKEQPQVLDIGDGKLYLAIPDEFTRAWRKTGIVMQQAGVKIMEQDQTKGLYTINYFDNTAPEKGFFSKLKFWKDDEPQPTKYQLSLTGVGNKTELIILDENGDWDTSDNAKRIMSLIQARYNAS